MLICLLIPFFLYAETNNHHLFTQLLQKHVIQKKVDYSGFQKDSATFEQYLDQLNNTVPDTLDNNHRMAFYINAYNACTIQFILTKYPDINSIKELGSLFSSPWKKKVCQINQKAVTLDHIEHNILRKDYSDPRIHFAINCASKSCPPLLNEAYTGLKLDEQLNMQARLFINTPSETYIQGKSLHVSKIFKWFSEDFGDIQKFINKYAEGQLKTQVSSQSYSIQYNSYDWSLNNR